MESTPTYSRQGKILNKQAREIVANVIKFMKAEAQRGSPLIPFQNIAERVAEATQISESTYRRIRRESVNIEANPGASFTTYRKKRLKTSPKSTLQLGQAEAIRQIVHDFYITEKCGPSAKDILSKIQESDIGYEGSLTTLYHVLSNLEFRWHKTSDKGKILTESYGTCRKRMEYLRAISKYRAEGRNIVFMDEMYLQSSAPEQKECTNGNPLGLKVPVTKSKKLVIIHAGGESGFVPNALLICTSSSKLDNLNDDMNHENFMQWINTQLLPNIPPNSVLVLDNAPYHNTTVAKDPTSVTLKKEMIQWLRQRSIPFSEDLTKPELYNIIKMHKPLHKTYELDILLEEYGHDVLRLPANHPELNPIEKIWAILENWVVTHSAMFVWADLEALARRKFEEITVDDWVALCQHCQNVEEEYIKKEHILDNTLEELQFTIQTSSSDEELELSEDERDDVEP